MDSKKVSVILSWPTPRTIGDVRSFHGLPSFNRKFIKNFTQICAPMLETIKGGKKCNLSWIDTVDEAFGTLK